MVGHFRYWAGYFGITESEFLYKIHTAVFEKIQNTKYRKLGGGNLYFFGILSLLKGHLKHFQGPSYIVADLDDEIR